MNKRVTLALIIASVAFGFVLGWIIAGGRSQLDRPTPGEMSQQMAPGMNRGSSPNTVSPGDVSSGQSSTQNEQKKPEWKQALDENQKRVQANPNDAEAWRNLGKLYAIANMTQDAVQAYQKALDINPNDNQARVELGFVYLNTGQMDTADAIADEVLKRNPDDPDALFLKGTTLAMYHRDRKAAIATYERLLKIKPDYPMAPFVNQMIDQMKSRLSQSPNPTAKSAPSETNP